MELIALLAYYLGYALPISIGGYFVLVRSLVSKEDRKSLGGSRMAFAFFMQFVITIIVLIIHKELRLGIISIPLIGLTLLTIPGSIVALVVLWYFMKKRAAAELLAAARIESTPADQPESK